MHAYPPPRLRPGSYHATTNRTYRAIYEAWPDGITTLELAEAVGKSRSVVYAQVHRLMDAGVITKAGHGGRLYPKGYEKQ